MGHRYNLVTPQIETDLACGESLSTGDAIRLLWIQSDTTRKLKVALESIARCFKNEMDFDNLQYSADEIYEEPYTGFVLIQQNLADTRDYDFGSGKPNIQPHYVIGGGCFRNERDIGMKLDFVWLHPYARHRRIMVAAWKKMKNRFGEFDLTKPLSLSMKHFLEMNAKHARPAERGG